MSICIKLVYNIVLDCLSIVSFNITRYNDRTVIVTLSMIMRDGGGEIEMRRKTEYRYLKLANILREQILTGLIPAGDFLMPENELSRTYGMSRTSVRRSLEQLVQEGLIEKEVGRGTRVKPGLIIGNGGSQTLRILAPYPSYFMDSGFDIIIEAFKKEFPTIDVKITNLPNVNYWQSINTTKDIGFQPDLVFISDRHFLQSVVEDQFIPIQESSFNKEQMYDKLLSAFSVNNKILAAPLTFSPVFLAYNATIFEKYQVEKPQPGWTVHDFIRSASKLTLDANGDGILDLYGFTLSASLQRWTVFLLRNGATTLGKDIDESILYETLNFFHDLIYRYKVAHVISGAQDFIRSNSFYYNKAAMVLTTIYEMSYWEQEEVDFEVAIAPLPFGTHSSTLLMANALMIPAQAQEPQLAQKFIQVALSQSVQQNLCESTPFLSVFQNVNERMKNESFLKTINIYRDMMSNNFFLDELVQDSEVEEIMGLTQMFWHGLESAKKTTEMWKAPSTTN